MVDDCRNKTLRFYSNDWCWQVLGLMLGPGLVSAFLIAKSAHLISIKGFYLHLHNPALRWLVDLAFVASLCVWLWLILRFVCWDKLSTLNLKPGRWSTDLLYGCALALILIPGFHYIHVFLVSCLHTGSSGAVVRETIKTAAQPLMIFIKLVPDSWLIAATFEEFMRVMILSRFWKLGSSKPYLAVSIAVPAVLFGLGHLYQGTTGVLSATMMALVFSSFYLAYGRVLPMIIAHGLFDSYAVLANLIRFWSYQSHHH